MSESAPKKSAGTDQKKPSKSKKKAVTKVGDFELKRRLGKGGMGEVFLAKQVSLDRLVALKTLSKELSKKEDFVARFLREARSMAKLDHSNVVKVYAVDSFKGLHFAAIEYIDGRSVQDWLNKLKKFPIADAVHIAIVAAQAMQHAHELNMVHRDIKPDNILLTSKGAVKVADFGLAKVLDEDVSMTQSGTGLGTPLYMAPEQARSAKTVDQRSDIYALGATLYHMLTGQLPFTGATALELIIAKESSKYPTARQVRSDVPEKLSLIIDKMMVKEPAHRYSDCRQVAQDLTALGLHSEALTFLEGAVPPTAVGAINSTLANHSPAQTQAASRPAGRSSRDDARRRPKKTVSQTWYVQYDDAQGKSKVEKLSTGRVLKMLKAGLLTAKGRAKLSADAAYLPLAKYTEFTEAVEESLQRKTDIVRKEDMKTLYKQVERDEKRRVRWRWLANKLRGFVGSLGLMAWLIAIGLIVAVVFIYGRVLIQYLGQHVTDLMNSSTK